MEPLAPQARALMESLPDGLVLVDDQGRCLEANQAACALLEREWKDLRGARIGEGVLGTVWRDLLARTRALELQLPHTRRSRHVDVLVRPAFAEGAHLVLLRDVSERRGLEEQLRQAQKMEAVGRLAGGVAHDFNNLLTTVLGFGDLALRRVSATDPVRSYLEEIRLAGHRAAGLAQQLLAFSRKQLLAPRVLDLGVIVAEMSRMLRRLIGEDIQLASVIDPGIGRVKADRGQVEQVLMNLAVNARDAMPDGGRLTVEVGNAELDAAYARQHVDVVPGRYVMLAVSDTGSGMDAETQRHIFEPFFTTKEAGRGTGLGLATVYGIVRQSGGSVWVYSELGKGTTFKVYLPRVEEPESEGGVLDASFGPRGDETVLVVEDDEAVRAMVREVLESHGYAVLTAETGAAACALHAEARGAVRLLLTDVVMPAAGGREIATRLRSLQPDLRVLFMSGYTDDTVLRSGILASGVNFLQKPFSPTQLARAVRDVLDRPRGSSNARQKTT
jgi:signal transduction histidine kinase/CheY-like chemotaxis protein